MLQPFDDIRQPPRTHVAKAFSILTFRKPKHTGNDLAISPCFTMSLAWLGCNMRFCEPF